MTTMESYRVIHKLDSTDSNKDIAIKYDGGKVKSEKYGEATLSGYLLLMNRHGKFPTVNVKRIEEKAYLWLNELGLDEYENEVFEKIKLPPLIAYTTPGTNPEKLELYFKTVLFTFLFDDAVIKLNRLNEYHPIKQQEDVLRLTEGLISIINCNGRGNSAVVAASKLNPMFKTICIILSDVCNYSFKQMCKDDYKRFARELMDFIRVNKWIQEYHNSPYTENDYLFLRCIDVGMSLLLETIYFGKDIHISDEIRMHPLFQRYHKNVYMHEALRNDIFSLKKEIVDKENLNFVLVKCRQHSLQKSIYETEKVANELIIDLKKDGIKLKSYFPADDSLKNCIETAEYVLDGILHWYQHSRRYGNMKFETYVIEYDCDYNSWLEQIGIIHVDNMKEPIF